MKWRVVGLCIIALICVMWIGVNKKNKSEEISKSLLEEKQDSLNMAIQNSGWSLDSKVIISEAEVWDLSIDNTVSVHEIIEGKGKWEKESKLFKQLAETLLDTPTSAFFGDDGYFVSAIPIFYYNTEENELSNQMRILLFSKDLKNAAEMVLIASDNAVDMNLKYEWTRTIHKMMKEAPYNKYIFMFNKNVELILDEDNNIVYSYPSAEYEIIGDCYGAMQESMAISYDNLTAEENLIWVQAE